MNLGERYHRWMLFILKYTRHLKTRRAFCALCLSNYTAGLLLVSWLFANQPAVLNACFCLSSFFVGISVTALYLNAPMFIFPDAIYKGIIITCALFQAILDADQGAENPVQHIVEVFIAASLQFYENYFLFNALAAMRLNIDETLPPPPYHIFYKSGEPSTRYDVENSPKMTKDEEQLPSYDQAMKTIAKDESQEL